MNPNARLDRDLERWLRAEAPANAPAGLHAAVIDRARTRRQRPGWATSGPARWLGRNRGLTLFAAAALLLVGGAMAAGSGLVRLPSVVPPGPPPTIPSAITSPTAVVTAGPNISPATSPIASPRPIPVIAYVNYNSEANQMAMVGRVWIVGTNGTGAHELFPGGTGDQTGVAWSPDGTQLVYAERDPVHPAAGTHLYMTDATGSAPRKIDPGCGSSCFERGASFSSDGSRLALLRADGSTGTPQVATLNLATGEVVELSATASVRDERPRWSPDGKQILFSRWDKSGNGSAVFIVDADGQNLRQLSSSKLPARLPDWSPDGSRIVFTSLEMTSVKEGSVTLTRLSQDVYSVRPDWTDLRRLTEDGDSIGATWTADGRILFATGGCQFTCTTPDTGSFWVMNADGSGTQLLVPGAGGQSAPLMGIDAAWQPTP
jgi:Tol biopolymer transport system component